MAAVDFQARARCALLATGLITCRSQSSLPEVGKNPIDTVYRGISGRSFNGHQLNIPTSTSHLRIVFLDTIGCLEDVNGVEPILGVEPIPIDAFGENVAALMIELSSPTFVFLECPDPPRR
ncbi:hypothetical protein TNCV_1815711 [Trichonephila clavipes]|nr:hypothetical protein TNCV_1815711 [Trichonephila clavipes]